MCTHQTNIHFKWAQSKVWLGPKWMHLYSYFDFPFLCNWSIWVWVSWVWVWVWVWVRESIINTNKQMSKKTKKHTIWLELEHFQQLTDTQKKKYYWLQTSARVSLLVSNESTQRPQPRLTSQFGMGYGAFEVVWTFVEDCWAYTWV